MMLLAEISTLGMLVLCAAGVLVFLKFLGPAAGRHQAKVWKVLGFAAVGMGLGLLLIRTSSQVPVATEEVDYSQPDVGAEVFGNGEFEARGGELFTGERARQRLPREFRQSARAIPRWSIIVLGSLLVILGALVFGREKTRPGALKMATFLGIGSIIYLVGTFVGDPPRLPNPNVVQISADISSPDQHGPSPSTRSGHARRPSLRPRRPLADERADNLLPPRAAEIPVAAELAKTPEANEAPAAAAAPEAPPTEPAATEPAAAAPPATKPDPASPPAEAASAEAAPVAVPVSEPKPVIQSPTIVVAEPAVVVPTVSTPTTIHNEPRPDWVDAAAGLNKSVYCFPVKSGLFASVPECQRELDAEIKMAAAHYIDEYLADLSDHASALVDLPLPYLKKQVVKAEYAEVVESKSVGPMHQIHARLEFDDQVRSDVRRRLHDTVVEQRLWYVGGGAALVLALLATFFGYLKLDLWAGEGSRARLQLAATLVALVATAGVLLARYSVPF